ncbi:unnamed protein product [Oikopleura dioica]|uniref:Uncharacterized protein n=1 Tax=Oikopleura dioica TaxID=34765 RepID=E4YLE1_OIKDI|nr:unnamed protein product [Oikopleura dioica]
MDEDVIEAGARVFAADDSYRGPIEPGSSFSTKDETVPLTNSTPFYDQRGYKYRHIRPSFASFGTSFRSDFYNRQLQSTFSLMDSLDRKNPFGAPVSSVENNQLPMILPAQNKPGPETKVVYKPSFPKDRHFTIDGNAYSDETLGGVECYNLDSLVNSSFYLPEFPLHMQNFSMRKLYVPASEIRDRQKLQHYFADDFPVQTAENSEKPVTICERPSIAIYARHDEFLLRFGHYLHSAGLNPSLSFSLGHNCTVTINPKAAQYLALVERSHVRFVDELKQYLADYMRSLYCFVRGAYLHSAPETLCAFDRLNDSLDNLITSLLRQYPRLCHTGGFCLTTESELSFVTKFKKS